MTTKTRAEGFMLGIREVGLPTVSALRLCRLKRSCEQGQGHKVPKSIKQVQSAGRESKDEAAAHGGVVPPAAAVRVPCAKQQTPRAPS